jgi:hypothetical protein
METVFNFQNRTIHVYLSRNRLMCSNCYLVDNLLLIFLANTGKIKKLLTLFMMGKLTSAKKKNSFNIVFNFLKTKYGRCLFAKVTYTQ